VGVDAAARALAGATQVREADGPHDTSLRAEPVFAPSGRQVATVVVGASTEAIEDLQEKVLLGSLIVAALVLVAGAIAIRGAVRGALQPVADMTEAAADWSEHDLDKRFGLGPVRDELTGLAATLDGLLARIAASRRHDQRFASEVAHELRTPLARLRGRAELALQVDDPAEREAALAAVADQTSRMGETIDTLLAAARQEFGEERRSVDVAGVVSELEGVQLHVQAGLPAAEGDAELLRRALGPLRDNARRHARAQVSVDVEADDEWVRVAVRDDGPGLAPDFGERAFEPGVQGNGGGGAGLGLPLARRLARTCGGDVTAGEGPGGCFILTVPRARASQA
jgi:signal transduction histidine kinase